MTLGTDIFGPGSNFKKRFVQDYKELVSMTDSVKKLGLKIVLTLGTYDLTHIGHARYLEKAKEGGAVVIVGVDTDKAVKLAKGPRRPVVPEMERMEILTHLRHVDLVTLLSDYNSKGYGGEGLLKMMKPDVFVLSETTGLTKKRIAELKRYCKEVLILPPQAGTSTSAKIRLLTLDLVENLKKTLENFVDAA